MKGMLIVYEKWYKKESNERVIPLCDNASESCPWTPPEIKRLNWSTIVLIAYLYLYFKTL
jgi:hypothetical protein